MLFQSPPNNITIRYTLLNLFPVTRQRKPLAKRWNGSSSMTQKVIKKNRLKSLIYQQSGAILTVRLKAVGKEQTL